MLRISECFYSVQAEGASTGVPAIFIRLTGCNFMCGGIGGALMKEGKATWWCDTEAVWKLGRDWTTQNLYDKIVEMGQLQNVINGRTHLIWTGGEPTMPNHVKGIMDFIDFFRERHNAWTMFNEIETNGSIVVPEQLYKNVDNKPRYIDQINASVKLQNSGMAKSMRIVPAALKQILEHPNGYLKFVISNESDMQEIEEDFIKPFDVHWSKVILMPGLDKQADAPERTAFTYEMAKKYGYRGVTRGHVIAYDQLTGV